MKEERIFVAFARLDDDGKIKTETALLTSEQLSLLNWLYDRNLLNGTFESNDDICIEEP